MGDEMTNKVVVEEGKKEERKRRVLTHRQKFCVFTLPLLSRVPTYMLVECTHHRAASSTPQRCSGH